MMITRNAAALMAASSLFGGCAAITPQQQQGLQGNIPYCTDARQCEGMWAAARNWVPGNCGMKIQTMSDSFIDTFNSTDTNTACRVTKDPMPQGGYSFSIHVSCGNMFGCVPSVLAQIQSFQATVNSAARAFAGQAPKGFKYTLGVTAAAMSELPPAYAAAAADKQIKGVFIATVAAGSVAEVAGVKVGDDLYEFDGKTIRGSADLKAAIAAVTPGSAVAIKLLRNGAEESLTARF